MPSTAIDLVTTERFLATMLGDAWAGEALILQAFDDDADRLRREAAAAKAHGERYRSPRSHVGLGTWAQLQRKAQSWARDGCCVSWTLQRFEGKRRDHADYFQGIRCVVLDFDRPDTPLPAFPLPPHAVVETSPGKYHVYWRVDLSREAFDRLMPALIERYGADPQAGDVCRVMRLPGFLHQKRDARKGLDGAPHIVRLLETQACPTYSQAECWEAFQVDTWWAAWATTNGSPTTTMPASPTRAKSWPAILPTTGPIDLEAISRALAGIPADARHTWLTVGMALASTGHPQARMLWETWSQQSAKYDPDTQAFTWDSFRENRRRVTDEQDRVSLGSLFHLARQHGFQPIPAAAWKRDVLLSQRGEPTENAANITLWLQHDAAWEGRWWWDAVGQTPMCDEGPVSDQMIAEIAVWLGVHARMPIRNLALLQRCVTAICQHTPRDPIQQWLDGLPPWDGVDRLEEWLQDVAEAPGTAYGRAVSKLIPVSMVARARSPGCLYRYVVILEGQENSGKSQLVRALAQRWYANLSMVLESKESHIAIQGVWVAEMTELDSLSRSEENRIKAFLTMTQDDFVPKYSNTRVVYPRRTIFIGTTNEQQYLKGLSGNTRFLPIPTGTIDVALFERRREQLFAEALACWTAHQHDWWELSPALEVEVAGVRQERRVVNEYEGPLGAWLHSRVEQQITWPEIAQEFLGIRAAEGWKDKGLQMQIAQSIRALGWSRQVVRDGTLTRRIWMPAPVADGP